LVKALSLARNDSVTSVAPSSHSASITSGENFQVLRTSATMFQILSACAAIGTVTDACVGPP